MGYIRTNIYLTEAEQEYLAKASKKLGVKVAELIRRILDGWIEEDKAKSRKRG